VAEGAGGVAAAQDLQDGPQDRQGVLRCGGALHDVAGLQRDAPRPAMGSQDRLGMEEDIRQLEEGALQVRPALHETQEQRP
jgi:hypothetical protein